MNPHPRSPRQPSLAPFLVLAVFLAVCVVGAASGTGQSDQKEEREIEEQVPKHLPIKVKLKKPEKVKDSKNEKWLDDYELEVTNTGTKPIYYIYFSLSLPDVIDGGRNIGFQIRYGRFQLLDLSEPVQPDDVPILPGETVTLQIPENFRRGWKASRAQGRWPNPKKLLLRFQLLNHGDGTGFMTPDGAPLPNYNKVGATCREEDPPGAIAGNVFGSPPSRFPHIASSSVFLPLPVRLLPAKFFSGASPAEPATKLDICCTGLGPNCERLKPEGITCICGEVIGVQSAACSDPQAFCVTKRPVRVECPDSTGFIHFCDYDEMGQLCSSATPTPTPTPIPEPTPTPEPTPLPEPDCTGQPLPANCCECRYFFSPIPGGPVNADPAWDCNLNHCPANLPLAGGCVTKTIFQGIAVCPLGTDETSGRQDGICCPVPTPTPTPPGSECPPENVVPCPTDLPAPNPDEGPTSPPAQCCDYSPVLIDVNGDGFALTAAHDGVFFDFNGDGVRSLFSWTATGADDAWLALDRDGDGRIGDAAELFGNYTPQPTPPAGEERNGFLALAVFDQSASGGNGDGVIDRNDTVFGVLRLWQDMNHNGVSEPGELHTLQELGLKSIDLDYKESRRVDQYGNRFRYRAKVKDRRGHQLGRWAWDVFLVRAP